MTLRAKKSPRLLAAEKFTLQQSGLDRSAVEFHERASFART
jgi:hypothetical protein